MQLSDPPWLSPSLRILIDDRDRAYYLKQRSKYLHLREKVIDQTRFAKSMYLKSAISTGNVGKVWKAIKNVSRHNVSGPSCNSDLNADEFLDFFSSMCKSVDRSNNDHSACPESVTEPPDASLFLVFSTEYFYMTSFAQLLEIDPAGNPDILFTHAFPDAVSAVV